MVITRTCAANLFNPRFEEKLRLKMVEDERLRAEERAKQEER